MSKKFVTSPIGTAVYPHIHQPDTKYNPEGQYDLKIRVSKKDAEDFKSKILDATKDHVFKTKKIHIPIEEDKEGDGYIIKAKSKFKPIIYDSKKKALPDGINVSGGSEVRFFAEVRPYEKNGEGISLGLKQVQVIKLNANTFSAFDDVEDGFEVDLSNAETTSGFETTSALDI